VAIYEKKTSIIFSILVLFTLSYFVIAGIDLITLNSPANSTWDTDGNLTFTCNGTANNTMIITNTTLYVWNETGAAAASPYNTTLNTTDSTINGTLNLTFTLTNLPELQGFNYSWNCLFQDNESNTLWGTTNNTFGVDTSAPVITLISPANAGTDTDGTVVFKYNVTDANTIQNCTLYLSGTANETNSTITRSADQNFTLSSVPTSDTLLWHVSCLDLVNRTTNSSVYTLDTYANPAAASSSSGYNGKTYDSGSLNGLSETKTLRNRDSITLEYKGEEHTVNLKEVRSSYIKVVVSSTPVTKNIYLGESDKFDLDEDGNYDLIITLNNLIGSKAEIIFEEYTTPLFQEVTEEIIEEVIEEEMGETPFEENLELAPEERANNTILWVIGILVLMGIIWYFFKKKK
jgi:hypothetical protein